jgi:hypothetical protein
MQTTPARDLTPVFVNDCLKLALTLRLDCYHYMLRLVLLHWDLLPISKKVPGDSSGSESV